MDEESQHPQGYQPLQKHTACCHYALGLPPFFHPAGARAGASQRDLYCEIAHIFAPRQSHSEALLLQPCGTFASCDGRKGPQSFNQRSGKLFSVDVVVVVVQRMPSSLCQGPDNHLIQAYVCVMDLSWHTRRNVVGNKVIN